MFTGIIEEVGQVESTSPVQNGVRIRVRTARVLEGLGKGDSIAIDGVCQTVVALDGEAFIVESMRPTLERSTLGALRAEARVNLERALAVGDRLGGHMVQGHVDGTGRVLMVQRRGEHVVMDISLPHDVAEVTVPRGSLAVNGVSLTVADRPMPGVARVALIPYTWKHTNLSDLDARSRVNLEGDLLGRFVVDYLARTGRTEAGGQGSTGRRGGPNAV